jgi:cytochrome c5
MQLVQPAVRSRELRRTESAPVARRQGRSQQGRKSAARKKARSEWRRPLIVLGVSIWSSLVGFCVIRDFGPKHAVVDMDPARGKGFYQQSCVVCHGVNLQGMPHQGVDLRHSKFIASRSDLALQDFIKKGRTPTDPATLSGLAMPARGGNPSLSDGDLLDVVAFLRDVQKRAGAEPAPNGEVSAAGM